MRDPELAHRVAFLQNAEGTALAPFECFLFLRGIKTMWLRVNRAQENTVQIAKALAKHPRIKDRTLRSRSVTPNGSEGPVETLLQIVGIRCEDAADVARRFDESDVIGREEKAQAFGNSQRGPPFHFHDRLILQHLFCL